jgi:tetracycline resistance efflux pump
MEAINVGFLSVIPPIIAIGLALVTKEVISSLIIGILSGTFIYAAYTATGFGIITSTANVTMQLMSSKLADNAAIIVFLGLLGALVCIVTKAGGSKAYGEWASSKIKSRSAAQLATAGLGVLIFIDDYFNCLTVGTVMRPVTDKYRISHAKLSYLIDATAAPICIIAPVSSWAASVISQMDGTGLDGMSAFISTIPFNFYALLTVVMIIVVSTTSLDFGPMARFEKRAMEEGILDSNSLDENTDDEISKLKVSSKGTVADLVVPILVLIVTSILSMLYVGGYFEGGMTIAEGFGNTDAGSALALSSFVTVIITFLLFIPRKVLSFREFMSCITMGVKSMVDAYIILTLAWTISGVCRDLLNTGNYVGELVANSNMPVALIPVIIFLVAAFLSFSMGTSWGTFGILIPIIATVCSKVAPDLTIIALAATLAGSVLGDHCSPISDTTILSSTGANCHHMDHVSTQIPYVAVVGACCGLGYLVAGFTKSLALSLGTAFVALIIVLLVLHRMMSKKSA